MLLVFSSFVCLFLHFLNFCAEAETWPEYFIDVK